MTEKEQKPGNVNIAFLFVAPAPARMMIFHADFEFAARHFRDDVGQNLLAGVDLDFLRTTLFQVHIPGRRVFDFGELVHVSHFFALSEYKRRSQGKCEQNELCCFFHDFSRTG